MSVEISNDTVVESRGASAPGLFESITSVLRMAWVGYVVRAMLTFMFWSSGLAKLLDVDAGLAEMRHFGLEPAVLFYAATVVVLLGGSLLVILGRLTWLGAGALAVFTALTIPIAHDFWAMPEPFKTMEFHVVMEHITVIGALLVVIHVSATRKKSAAS